MKQRPRIWMLSAVVAGFALIFAGIVAATRSPHRVVWFTVVVTMGFMVILGLPIVILPWFWDRWMRGRGSDGGPWATVLGDLVKAGAPLIALVLSHMLVDRGGLRSLLIWMYQHGLLDWFWR